MSSVPLFKVGGLPYRIGPERRRNMAATLATFRDKHDHHPVSIRLGTMPIVNTYSLFGMRNKNSTPCGWLGQQLVLKIIDELLDTGGLPPRKGDPDD